MQWEVKTMVTIEVTYLVVVDLDGFKGLDYFHSWLGVDCAHLVNSPGLD